jgi:hypothetical protein
MEAAMVAAELRPTEVRAAEAAAHAVATAEAATAHAVAAEAAATEAVTSAEAATAEAVAATEPATTEPATTEPAAAEVERRSGRARESAQEAGEAESDESLFAARELCHDRDPVECESCLVFEPDRRRCSRSVRSIDTGPAHLSVMRVTQG